jgi:mRNA interferase YafQ
MRLKRHRSFIKDFKKVKLADSQFEKFIQFVNCLREDLPLPEESRDHALLGEYLDCREFHIDGDMLLIYLVSDEEIILLRIGTHAQLFK